MIALYYVAAFVLAASYNVVITQYTTATTRRAPWRGACFAASVSLISALQVLIYTKVPGAVIPQVSGAALGAFLGIHLCHQHRSN
jgi:hypothetical protein